MILTCFSSPCLRLAKLVSRLRQYFMSRSMSAFRKSDIRVEGLVGGIRFNLVILKANGEGCPMRAKARVKGHLGPPHMGVADKRRVWYNVRHHGGDPSRRFPCLYLARAVHGGLPASFSSCLDTKINFI